MSAALRAVFVAGALALAPACGDSDATPPEGDASSVDAPLVTVSSESKKLRVKVWTSPEQPPTRGTIQARYLIEDAATSAPVDGLVLDVSPEMPSMGHGTPITPTVEPAGGGVYLASDVNLFMAGRWELRTTVTGAMTDLVIVPVDVR